MKNFLKELKSHKLIYFLLFIILVGAAFVRVYNTKEILGFYYDQGRDALVIWNFIHKGDLFLVGPTTGIEGILRGPWYYYLILPFYFLGKGDPVWPANFLALTTVAAIFMLYVLGKEIFDRPTGLIAAAIASFSYYLIVASRWLSNPTPMLLISVLLVWSMLLVTKGKKWAWVAISILLGLSMQFGSATEAFYVPAVAIFAIWQRGNLPSKKILVICLISIFLIFLPQILFDFLKGGILTQSIKRFLFEEGSFKLSFWQILKVRLPFYWEVFVSKIWLGDMRQFIAFSLGITGIIIANFRKLWQKAGFKTLILLAASPLIGMIFFQGNEGNVFDYYFTGYYLIFVLIFSVGLGFLAKDKFGLIFLILFFILFFKAQLLVIRNYLIHGRSNVSFKEQLLAVDWVYKDAGGSKFNVDVYVPPVIPYAYDYLFLWRSQKYGREPTGANVSLLYTLYEEDIAKRLNPWLARQDTIGRVEKQASFRGLTVQRRARYEIK